MKKTSLLTTYAFGIMSIATLTGCVVTGAETTSPNGTKLSASPTSTKNEGAIIVTEGDITNRPYKNIGQINAYARSLNLLASDPTRDNIDEELRAEAVKIGADAVIFVKYETKRQGLAKRGHMMANGQAVIFQSNK